MPAGRRDKLVDFQHLAAGEDAYGEEAAAWTSLGEEWAAVFWGRGEERRAAAVEQGAQPATFQVLDNPRTREVRLRDRIVWEGNWDITGIAFPKRGEIEFSAVRAL